MNGKKLPLYVLTVVAIVGIVAAVGIFAGFTSGLFSQYDMETSTMAGPSPLLALIPAGVGVIAGVGALVLWGIQRQQPNG